MLFDCDDPIIQEFDNIYVEKCGQNINLLQEFFHSPDVDKKGIIKGLLDTQEHWLPSLLIEKDINLERTINKAQCF